MIHRRNIHRDYRLTIKMACLLLGPGDQMMTFQTQICKELLMAYLEKARYLYEVLFNISRQFLLPKNGCHPIIDHEQNLRIIYSREPFFDQNA